MDPNDLFESMYRLTKQLKGAPLRGYEKKTLAEVFDGSEGTPFERAEKAVASVLHADPSYIYEQAEALDDVGRMIDAIRDAAEKYTE